MDNHKLYAPCWETITEDEFKENIKICEYFNNKLYPKYNHRTGETEWFYEDEGLSKIYLVMTVDTTRCKHYYKNINVIK